MDQHRVDTATRSFIHLPSRRDVLRGLASAGLGLGLVSLADRTAAKQRKPKKRKPKPNAYGCLNVGAACKNAGQCCSNICTGKKGKRKCAAHDRRICQVEQDLCTTGVNAVCDITNSNCQCVRTTGNAAFCGDVSLGLISLCRNCSRDVDCEGEFGPGAACIAFGGICEPVCPGAGGTACVARCPTPAS
jgi:hypothetical protein